MNDKLTKQQTDAILQALDKAITTGPWEKSNFLRVIGKNLQDIRNNFANLLSGGQEAKQLETSAQESRALQRASQLEVFIALYASDGSNLQSWERILANLPRQLISRPVYSEEINVENLIKSKENKVNEAYVAVYILQTDILTLPSDKIPVDKFGKPLLTIKDRSLNLDNISRFVHLSGTYNYQKGRLIKSS
ncbi:Dot/Icm secretion system protein IcmQ [Legionella massiliensis]|uniref:Dot/Icm secretion system protein IcmQ n=1 Tax=Legionella massiliensis TaxID=1034943 RepID=A0A078KZ00_9GAMM|nr:Dot/Icm secretion system protein IcmQ [Legionella massiliensis]CDZ76913.1 Dot/Icm secretion system protein IcmQ [Legionella massiliensis]CEE12651.1 Dot/Icm secretion system protein (dot_icm_IcmQ) [Legionella massiliensis]